MVKRLPRKSKSKKKPPRSRKFLLLILFLILLFACFKTWQMARESKWDGKTRFNFALVGEEVSLATFSPPEEELVFLNLPKGMQIEVTHGYGKYRVEAITGLEKQEKRPGLLAESLQENLGVPIGGWIYTTDNKEELSNEIGKQILGRGETNLSKWDLVRLWWQVRKLRYARVKTLDLGKIRLLVDLTLPDRSKVWEIDKTSFDRWVQRLVFEPEMQEEHLGIEILNGTSHPGLAEKAARLLANIGGEVVWAGNSEIKYQRSNIKSQKEQKNSYTVQRIMKIFNAEWEEKNNEERGEITLILGEDYWQKLSQK